MYKSFAILLLTLLASCSPFHKFSKHTIYESKDGYVNVSNSKAKFTSKTFGDIKFAGSKKEFCELNGNRKAKFKNILFYGKASEPEYEYYVLINAKSNMKPIRFFEKDTTISGNRIILLVSDKAPKNDIEFISNNLLGH